MSQTRPIPGDEFHSPASDYARVVRVIQIDGHRALCQNLDTLRRTRVSVVGLSERWKWLRHPGEVSTKGASSNG